MGRKRFVWGFVTWEALLSLSTLRSLFSKQPNIQHVNLIHEPLISVDRLLGVFGAMYNDKD